MNEKLSENCSHHKKAKSLSKGKKVIKEMPTTISVTLKRVPLYLYYYLSYAVTNLPKFIVSYYLPQ